MERQEFYVSVFISICGPTFKLCLLFRCVSLCRIIIATTTTTTTTTTTVLLSLIKTEVVRKKVTGLISGLT